MRLGRIRFENISLELFMGGAKPKIEGLDNIAEIKSVV
jgi:hypothetical protein